MAYPSPYGSPLADEAYYRERYSATPTPSPRGYYYGSTPERPATRAHMRGASHSYDDYERYDGYSHRPPTASPRYTSRGHYATDAGNVSRGHYSRDSRDTPSRKHRHSFVVVDQYGHRVDPDYVKLARARYEDEYFHYQDMGRGRGTDYPPEQSGFAYVQHSYHPPPRRGPAPGHSRRPSESVHYKHSSSRPKSSHQEPKKPTPPPARAATEADAKAHRIPAGYSLKNWDPEETPILLLGSVFDANSLGKWIYDWTIFSEGVGSPIAEMAGELWLLLIQLAGKVKRLEEAVGAVRAGEKQEVLDDFIGSGDRLFDRLFALLKTCEAPMLKANKSGSDSLGKGSGVEFVETLFGRERQLEKTERFMQAIRLFNLRFDVNCEAILAKPTK